MVDRAPELKAPVEPSVLVGAAVEALRRASHDDAEALLTTALALDPALAEAWAVRGALALARGREGDARRAYQRAVELDDHQLPVVLTLAELYGRGDAADVDRALALVTWLILEPGISPEILTRAAALKRRLRPGVRA